MDSIFRLSGDAFASAVLDVYNNPDLGRSWSERTISALKGVRVLSAVGLPLSIGSVAFPVLRGPIAVVAIVVSAMGVVGCTWAISVVKRDNEVMAAVSRIDTAAGILKSFNPAALTKENFKGLIDHPIFLQNEQGFTRALEKLRGKGLSGPEHAQMLIFSNRVTCEIFGSKNLEQVADAMIVLHEAARLTPDRCRAIDTARNPVGMARALLLLEGRGAQWNLVRYLPTLSNLYNPLCVAEGMCFLSEKGWDIDRRTINDGTCYRSPLDLLVEESTEGGPQQRARVMEALNDFFALDQFACVYSNGAFNRKNVAGALYHLRWNKISTPENQIAVCRALHPEPMAKGLALLRHGEFSDHEMVLLRQALSSAGQDAPWLAGKICDMQRDRDSRLGHFFQMVTTSQKLTLAMSDLEVSEHLSENFDSLLQCQDPRKMAEALLSLNAYDSKRHRKCNLSTPENRDAVRAAKDDAMHVVEGLRILDAFDPSRILDDAWATLFRDMLLRAGQFADVAAEGVVSLCKEKGAEELTAEDCDVFASIRDYNHAPVVVKALLFAREKTILGRETYETLSLATTFGYSLLAVETLANWNEAKILTDERQRRFRALGENGMYHVAGMTSMLKKNRILNGKNLSWILTLDAKLIREVRMGFSRLHLEDMEPSQAQKNLEDMLKSPGDASARAYEMYQAAERERAS